MTKHNPPPTHLAESVDPNPDTFEVPVTAVIADYDPISQSLAMQPWQRDILDKMRMGDWDTLEKTRLERLTASAIREREKISQERMRDQLNAVQRAIGVSTAVAPKPTADVAAELRELRAIVAKLADKIDALTAAKDT